MGGAQGSGGGPSSGTPFRVAPQPCDLLALVSSLCDLLDLVSSLSVRLATSMDLGEMLGIGQGIAGAESD